MMAISTRLDPLGMDGRGEFIRAADEAKAEGLKIINNDRAAHDVSSAIWGNPYFRASVLIHLRETLALREQANELRIIKRVFRGES